MTAPATRCSTAAGASQPTSLSPTRGALGRTSATDYASAGRRQRSGRRGSRRSRLGAAGGRARLSVEERRRALDQAAAAARDAVDQLRGNTEGTRGSTAIRTEPVNT